MNKFNGACLSFLVCAGLLFFSCSDFYNDLKNSGAQVVTPATSPAPTQTPATDPEPAPTPTSTPSPSSAASGAYTKIGTQTINGVDYDIVTFGLWPQTRKAENVTVDKNETESHGIFTYCKGSDEEWYFEAGRDDWFKVEPIKWRVLTTNYNGTGNKLLLAETILESIEYYYYNYSDIYRTINGKTVYPNNYEHSKVRAFLNGLSYKKNNDYMVDGNLVHTQVDCDDYLGKGFLHSAFTDVEQSLIVTTEVNNGQRTTNPDDNATLWNGGNNPYASDMSTNDKIFLLSEQEITKKEFGFSAYDQDGPDKTRARNTTDYATEAYLGWWLRSPCCDKNSRARSIWITEGKANSNFGVNDCNGGIVPALCVAN